MKNGGRERKIEEREWLMGGGERERERERKKERNEERQTREKQTEPQELVTRCLRIAAPCSDCELCCFAREDL